MKNCYMGIPPGFNYVTALSNVLYNIYLFPKTIKIYIAKHYLNKGVVYFSKFEKKLCPKIHFSLFGIQIYF